MSMLTGIAPVWFADLACRIINLHAGYKTFKAMNNRQQGMEAKEGTDETLEQWLPYWICVSAFLAVEFWADLILFWFPWYVELKVVLLVFLGYKGLAKTLYTQYIKRFLSTHQASIDEMMTVEGIKRRVQSVQRAPIPAASN